MGARPQCEQRQNAERRVIDFGPLPGSEERRKTPERRGLIVDYIDIDEYIEIPPVIPRQ